MTKLSIAGIDVVPEMPESMLRHLSEHPYRAFQDSTLVDSSVNLVIRSFSRSDSQIPLDPSATGGLAIRRYTSARQRHGEDLAIVSDTLLVLYRQPERRLEVFWLEPEPTPLQPARGALGREQVDHCVTLLVLTRLAENDGLLLHGSGFVIDGVAAAVIGPSGAGKTTAALLTKHDALLSDDVVAVTDIGAAPLLHGTPLGRMTDGPLQAPLKALFFPKKADRCRIEPLSAVQAYERYLYEHADYASKGFVEQRGQVYQNAARLFDEVPAFELAFALHDLDTSLIRECMTAERASAGVTADVGL